MEEAAEEDEEDVTLLEKGTLSQEDKILINTKIKLQHYWNASLYYIEAPSEKSQSVDIQRFSDKGKTKRSRRRENLSEHLKCSSFPIELHDELLQKRGPKRTRAPKRARSTVGGLEKLDMFEKLEQEGQNKEALDKPKKEGDEEEDAEKEDDEEDAEYSDDGDYNQTEYFDDDEDDNNDGLGSDHDGTILACR
ncbi:hypothetical protein QQ045_028800 [Rhodiola kirilowii]